MSFRSLLLPCSIVLATVCAGSASAAKIKVGTAGVDTIQAAVQAALLNADESDVILVPAGVYDESLFITLTGQGQSGLTIQRSGKGEVRIRGLAGEPAIRVSDARGVRLTDITVESGSNDDGVAALEISGSVVDLVGERLTGVAGDDVGVAVLGTATRGVLLDDCRFSGMTEVGFWLDGERHRLEDSRADDCGRNAVVLAATSSQCRIERFSATAGGGTAGIDTGLVTIRGSDHVITDSVVRGASGRGFTIHGDGHLLERCESTDHAYAAFEVLSGRVRVNDCRGLRSLHGLSGGGEGLCVAGGRFDQNSSHGILIWIVGAAVIESITADANSGSGVVALAGTSHVGVLFSSMKGNTGAAALIEGADCWLEGNKGKKGNGFVDAGAANAGRGNTVAGAGPNDFP